MLWCLAFTPAPCAAVCSLWQPPASRAPPVRLSKAVIKRATHEPAAAPAPPASVPRLVFPGGGIFFWWQLGAVRSLQRRFDLADGRASFSGASAGALAATLAAAGVTDTERTLDLAIELAARARVWERGKWGLYGIWGSLIHEWLEGLLPPDAAARCGGRLAVAVKAVPRLRRPWFETELVDEFEGRRDLIEACMASVHVPLFLNRRWTARFRGARYVDGSLSLRGDGEQRLYLPLACTHASRCIRLCHRDDPRVRARYSRPSDFLAAASPEACRELMGWGAEHVARLDAEGGLQGLEPLRR